MILVSSPKYFILNVKNKNMWKFIRCSAISKRFFSTPTSRSPSDQEITYNLKEFLKDYEARTKKSQEELKESLQRCIASSQNNFKESVRVHGSLYKHEI
jgi:hypothetical protein